MVDMRVKNAASAFNAVPSFAVDELQGDCTCIDCLTRTSVWSSRASQWRGPGRLYRAGPFKNDGWRKIPGRRRDDKPLRSDVDVIATSSDPSGVEVSKNRTICTCIVNSASVVSNSFRKYVN